MKLYNTQTKQLEEITKKQLNMFVCGPTVYDYIQLGNAKTFTQFDIIARAIRALGYDLTYIQNITDIDDKIIKRAHEKGVSPSELAEKYTTIFKEDMSWLNNTSANKLTPATDYMEHIVSQVETLLKKGFAYTTDDGIYFEIAKFSDYGKLSGRNELKEDDAQSRIDESDQKRGWNDFALWKFKKEDEPSWEAPFGEGRPGWHIEDTAITEAEFGPQYDIHGGAVDLIFPHHEAEITQMEAASGKVPFVSTWMHAGFLTITGDRMGKSMGNYITVRAMQEEGIDPNVLRLLFAQAHYRSALDYSEDVLSAAKSRWLRWRSTAALRWQDAGDSASLSKKELSAAREAILAALARDIQTPEALNEIEAVFTSAQAGIPEETTKDFTEFIEFIDETFGFQLVAASPNISDTVRELIQERRTARDEKDFTKADQLRDELATHNITVKDGPKEQFWMYIH